jgi:hypothetical protein
LTWFKAPSVISTRYGTSFSSSASTSGQPEGWPTVATSGGTAQPLKPGDTARASQPEGRIRNANPIASAECGIASIGAIQAPSRRADGRWCTKATISSASSADKAVAAQPVPSDSHVAVAKPGACASARQASRPSASPPSAGSQPKAGSKVPASPATMGPRKSVRVSAGAQRSSPAGGRGDGPGAAEGSDATSVSCACPIQR